MNKTLLPKTSRAGATPANSSVDTGWLPAGSGFIGASWFAPTGREARRAAVLIVPGIVHEQRAMFDGLAALARSLATAGFGSLLIDLHGTAQASGRLDVADIGERWRQDIRSAVGHLRAGGFDSVIVVGVRVGALLARSALEGERLAGFVAWAPVLSGRRHVRELKMMDVSGAASGRDEGGAAAGGVSVGGHDIPKTVLAHLATQTFEMDAGDAGQPMLILGEADATPPGGTADHRVAVDLQRWLHTPHEMPIIPQADIRAVVDWCSRRQPIARPAPTHASRRRPRVLKEISLACDGLAVRERTVRFGRAGLSGIVSEPLHQPSFGAARLLATLDGPGRLFPTMAREEAVRGKTSMRFEFAGFSSSGLRPDRSGGELYSPRKRDDIAEAITCLRKLGHARVTMVGFCAGAWSVIHAANLPNVTGVVAINAQLYRQPDYRLRDIALRAGHPLAKTLGVLRRVAALTKKVDGIEHRIPAVLETGRWLRRLGELPVPPLLIYSTDDDGLAHLDHSFGRAVAGRAAPWRTRVRRPHDRIAIGRYSGLGHSLEGPKARCRAVEAIHTYLADVDARLTAEPAPTTAAATRRLRGDSSPPVPDSGHWNEPTWAHSPEPAAGPAPGTLPGPLRAC